MFVCRLFAAFQLFTGLCALLCLGSAYWHAFAADLHQATLFTILTAFFALLCFVLGKIVKQERDFALETQ